MLHNLLPQDCRAVELASAGAMLAMAFYMLTGTRYVELCTIHPYQFWVILFTVFGSLQLLALFWQHKMELQQFVMALVNGSIWVWLAFVAQEPAALFIGLSNLYAFSVGFLFLKRSWLNY